MPNNAQTTATYAIQIFVILTSKVLTTGCWLTSEAKSDLCWSQRHQPDGSNWTGLKALWLHTVNFSHLVGVSESAAVAVQWLSHV